MLGGILFAHCKAHEAGKPPFFFSRWNFLRMKERGNTHYCFHCGGGFGFTPGKDGVVTNHMDNVINLCRPDGSEVLVKDALRDKDLAPHLTNSPGYPRLRKGDPDYEAWRRYQASFDHSDRFEAWCKAKGYAIRRHNPMKNHDPVRHADAVVGGALECAFAAEWLEKHVKSDFPYLVAVT